MASTPNLTPIASSTLATRVRDLHVLGVFGDGIHAVVQIRQCVEHDAFLRRGPRAHVTPAFRSCFLLSLGLRVQGSGSEVWISREGARGCGAK
eukprot:3628143-Rhodomonas_salina.4